MDWSVAIEYGAKADFWLYSRLEFYRGLCTYIILSVRMKDVYAAMNQDIE